MKIKMIIVLLLLGFTSCFVSGDGYELKGKDDDVKLCNKKITVRFLEQQKQVLETKWCLLQQQGQKGGSQKPSIDYIFEAYINNLKRQLDSLENYNGHLNSEVKTMPDLAEDFKKKYEDEINRRTAPENDFVLLRKFKQLQTVSGQHGDSLKNTNSEILDLNYVVQRLRIEIKAIKKQIAVLQQYFGEAEQHGVSPLKDTQKNLAEMEAAQQKLKKNIAHQKRDYQELLSVKRGLDIEIATYGKLIEEEEEEEEEEESRIK